MKDQLECGASRTARRSRERRSRVFISRGAATPAVFIIPTKPHEHGSGCVNGMTDLLRTTMLKLYTPLAGRLAGWRPRVRLPADRAG